MPNLIEQMNVLKGLSDEALSGEMGAPSGSVPPYLVLSEVNRRKDMRQRYEGQQAQRAKRTTVMEDLLPPGMNPAMMGGMMGGGMGQAMPSGIGAAVQPEVPGFADGGIVDYSDIAGRYNERLGALPASRDRARALALIAAGAGIMGGKHQNTLRNVGEGISAAVPVYQTQLNALDSEEANLLRGLTDVGQMQHQNSLSELNAQLTAANIRRAEQEIQQNTPQYWLEQGKALGLEGADLDRYAASRGTVGKSSYSAATVFGVDENGDEVSARTNLTTGEYKPNPRPDGTVPSVFIPYSADELTTKRDQAKVDVKKAAQLPADTAGVTDSLRAAQTAMDTIKRAYTDLSWANTGMIGAVSDMVPGGGWAKDARSLIKTLQSGLAASALQAMRDASKTGGALGNVSDKDLELLQTKIANLDPNQSEEQLKEQLEVIYNELNAALQTRVSTFEQTYKDTPGVQVPDLQLPPPTFQEFMEVNVDNDPMDSLVEKYRTQ